MYENSMYLIEQLLATILSFCLLNYLHSSFILRAFMYLTKTSHKNVHQAHFEHVLFDQTTVEQSIFEPELKKKQLLFRVRVVVSNEQ